ncbi:MAG: hemerythrin domain-containing protein [Phycisphaerales bacterium]|nr:hemerythrin domain-containing protein [Phycisphaerales bacterium]
MVGAHDVLDEAFAAHQDALVEGRVLEAKERFFAFRDALLDHMQIEDDQLLPVYALMPDPPVGGGVDVFRAEHDRIRKLLGEFSGLFERLQAPLASRDLVTVIERQRLLKHVLEHHNLREQTHLYPMLDQFDDKGMLLRLPTPPCPDLGRTAHAV